MIHKRKNKVQTSLELETSLEGEKKRTNYRLRETICQISDTGLVLKIKKNNKGRQGGSVG